MLLNSIMMTPSLFVTAISVVSLVLLINLAYSEIKGNHLKYSKFWNINSTKSATKVEVKVSSRTGMLLLYTPAFFAGLACFWLFPDEGFRFFLLNSALTFHFLKRVLELWYIVNTYHRDYQSQQLKIFGTILFLMGVSGNFYHHYLLSKMRKDGEKQYKIPKGGLFDKVVKETGQLTRGESDKNQNFWGFRYISVGVTAERTQIQSFLLISPVLSCDPLPVTVHHRFPTNGTSSDDTASASHLLSRRSIFPTDQFHDFQPFLRSTRPSSATVATTFGVSDGDDDSYTT